MTISFDEWFTWNERVINRRFEDYQKKRSAMKFTWECAVEAALQKKVDRQKELLTFAVDNLGATALNRDERAARMVEEAIEVGQVEGVTLDLIKKIADYIYSRPPGRLAQEIAGVGVTLEVLAENVGIVVDTEIDKECNRIYSLPKEWWHKKHLEKTAAGIADLSPVNKE